MIAAVHSRGCPARPSPIVGDSQAVVTPITRVAPPLPSSTGEMVIVAMRCREDIIPDSYVIELKARLADERFDEISLASIHKGIVTVSAP